MVNVLQREKRGDIFVFSARASGRFFFFGGVMHCSLPMITTIPVLVLTVVLARCPDSEEETPSKIKTVPELLF